MERHARHFLAECAEWVDVAFTDPAEILEVDAQLIRRMGRLHERGLVDAELFDEPANVRQRRFADADDADILALDQRDGDQRSEQLGERARAHPPGGSAAEDDDAGLGRMLTHRGTYSRSS